MKKVVLMLDLHDDKAKSKAMKTVSGLSGIDSIAMDMKDKKLTVIGDVDPVMIVGKLRKLFHTEIVSVGPAKEPEKKKDEPKKEEPKKDGAKKDDDKKKDPNEQTKDIIASYRAYGPYNYHMPPPRYYVQSSEENPNACVIC